MAVPPDGSLWLLDVRPGNLIKEPDAQKFVGTLLPRGLTAGPGE
ncbi:hypothetical protein [Streptomyces sp. NPDC050704]